MSSVIPHFSFDCDKLTTVFEVPNQRMFLFTKVPWPQVADMLDAKFKSATGRGLNEDNLKFLAGKAFRLERCVLVLSV